jgi:hypothetical protein
MEIPERGVTVPIWPDGASRVWFADPESLPAPTRRWQWPEWTIRG